MNSRKFIFLIFIFTISFISAAYNLGKEKYSIETIYSTGDDLRGWINISFDEESSNSIFRSSEGGKIELLNLLKKSLNTKFKYTCDLKNCESDYSAEDSKSEKIYNLKEGESVIFGIQIIDNNQLDSIESLQFKLESNNTENTKNPLSLDFLNNGINEWKAHNVSENYGEYTLGCFGSSNEKTKISSALYCEKIAFEEVAGIEIGAYVTRNNGEGAVPFIIGISNLDTGNTVTCETSASGEIGIKERIACTPNFQIKESGEYHICVGLKNPTADATKYEINFEETNPCGFAGTYNGEYDFDFEIFGRQNKYAPNIDIIFNNIELENSQSEVTNIEDYIEDYIEGKYENNCTTGCIIPIKLIANADQQIKISELSLSYLVGIQKGISKIFDITERYPLISATHQKLFLDEADFNVSNIEKEYNISFYFKENKLFEEEIKVEKAPVIYYVRPEITARKYPTTFSIKISQPTGISKYKWNFSDGVVTTTTVPEVSHTYEKMGKYPLIITLTNSKGMNFSSEFEINVGSASEVVPSLLNRIDSSIRFLESKLVVFPDFQKRSVTNALKMEELKETLKTLEKNSKDAITESDYEKILNEILKIKLPETIGESFVGEGIIFYPYTDAVNLDVLKSIGGGSYNPSKEQEYKEAILSWELDNAEMELNFSEVSAIYKEYQEPIVKIFEVSINNFHEEPVYFIIKDMENLLFYTDYPFVNQDGYKYLEIDSSTQSIIFSTTEEIDFEELPIFVSPSLTEINILDLEEFNEGEFFKKWGLFILIILGILVFTFVIYIVLQIWYKKKYEEYLFKNRNNLYNLVNYIKTSFAKGMKESEIEKNLRKAKWNSEQIRYAMRKYHGKNTGMPEIPVKKIVSRKKEK